MVWLFLRILLPTLNFSLRPLFMLFVTQVMCEQVFKTFWNRVGFEYRVKIKPWNAADAFVPPVFIKELAIIGHTAWPHASLTIVSHRLYSLSVSVLSLRCAVLPSRHVSKEWNTMLVQDTSKCHTTWFARWIAVTSLCRGLAALQALIGQLHSRDRWCDMTWLMGALAGTVTRTVRCRLSCLRQVIACSQQNPEFVAYFWDTSLGSINCYDLIRIITFLFYSWGILAMLQGSLVTYKWDEVLFCGPVVSALTPTVETVSYPML